MSANLNEPTTPAKTPTTTPAAKPNASTSNQLAGVELTAEQLSQLERDMQLKDPAEVTLPGGRTLKDVIDARNLRERNETAAARKDAKLPEHSSTVMTTRSIVATDDQGNVVTMPFTPAAPASSVEE